MVVRLGDGIPTQLLGTGGFVYMYSIVQEICIWGRV